MAPIMDSNGNFSALFRSRSSFSCFFFLLTRDNGTDEGQSLFQSPFPCPATLAAIFRNISRATKQLHGARLSYTQVAGTIFVRWKKMVVHVFLYLTLMDKNNTPEASRT